MVACEAILRYDYKFSKSVFIRFLWEKWPNLRSSISKKYKFSESVLQGVVGGMAQEHFDFGVLYGGILRLCL